MCIRDRNATIEISPGMLDPCSSNASYVPDDIRLSTVNNAVGGWLRPSIRSVAWRALSLVYSPVRPTRDDADAAVSQIEEILDRPSRRMVTTTVAVPNGRRTRLPVHTSFEVPEDRVMDVVCHLRSVEISTPTRMGNCRARRSGDRRRRGRFTRS